MNSLLRLDENGLNLLSGRFREIETRRRSGGLGLAEFIDAVVCALGEGEDVRTAELEEELCKVFAEIDVDGDNTVTWEEFSSHCIDAGVAASSTPVDYSSLVRFRLMPEFNQPQGRQLSVVKSLHGLGLVAVCEANCRCVKLYDKECAFLGEFFADCDVTEVRIVRDAKNDTDKKLAQQNHTLRPGSSSQRQHTVLDIEFCRGTVSRTASGATTLSDLGTLVTSTSDVCCSFFKVTKTVKDSLRISVINRVYRNLRSPQTICHWSPILCKLFSSDDSGVLIIWTVDTSNGGKTRKRDRIHEHHSRITCMTTSQRFNVLFTSGLDKRILQWSATAMRTDHGPTKPGKAKRRNRRSKCNQLRVTAEFCGHRLGVTDINLVLNDSVLVSVGFEYEVYCWCTIGHTILCKLSGHRYPLLGTKLCSMGSPGSSSRPWSDHIQQQLLSLDVAGNLRSWAISYIRCSSNKAKCVQELALLLTPKSFDIVPISHNLIVASYNLKLLQNKPMVTKSEDDGSFLLAVAYNDLTQTMVAGVNCSLYKWKLSSSERHVFHKVTSSDITCTDIGHRGRKVFVGTMEGTILILNLANGNLLRKASAHASEICGLRWIHEDNILLSSSTDKVVKVQADLPIKSNELTTGYEMKVVRQMELCGAAATCVAFSRELSLVAAGTSDGVVVVWDFQTAGFEGFCEGHQGEVIYITFIGTRPLMLVADTFGNVKVWAVQPHPEKYERALFDLTEVVNSTTITQLYCHSTLENPKVPMDYMELEGGTITLACGDDDGIVSTFDVTMFFGSCPVRPIPAHKLNINKPGYKPARCISEETRLNLPKMRSRGNKRAQWTQMKTEPKLSSFFGDDNAEQRTRSLRNVLEPEAILLGRWQAHERQITRLCGADHNIISCTFKLEAKVWNLTGELLAIYSAKEQDVGARVFHPLATKEYPTEAMCLLEMAIPEDIEPSIKATHSLTQSKSREKIKLAARVYSEKRREREMQHSASKDLIIRRNKILSGLMRDDK